jgi:hypothetical protein
MVKGGQMGGERGRLVVLPPLPGRWLSCMLYRWLMPLSNLRQAFGFGDEDAAESAGARVRF